MSEWSILVVSCITFGVYGFYMFILGMRFEKKRDKWPTDLIEKSRRGKLDGHK